MTSTADVQKPALGQDGRRPIEKLTRCGIVGNAAVISAGFLLNFTAFHATVNLQTSLYHRNSLGNRILVVLNLAAFLSNLLLTLPVNGWLGLKWSMFLCLLTHGSLPASNLYPVDVVLYLGAVVTGLGAGPLWSAKSTYLTVLGGRFAELGGGGGAEAAISRFFGVFFMIYYGASVLGNGISSTVLRLPHRNSRLSDATLREVCAANFCYGETDAVLESFPLFPNVTSVSAVLDMRGSATNLTLEHDQDFGFQNQPSDVKVAALFGILSACSVLSSPLVVLLTALDTSSPEEGGEVRQSLSTLFRQMKKPEEFLLLPLALYSGVIFAFITADYCVAYITCTVGIDSVGFVMSAFGVAAGLGAIVFGPLLKYTGRRAIFVFGAVLNAAVLVALLEYSPTSDGVLALSAFAGLWGLATVIWTSQYLAFIGYVFRDGNKEAAFACNYTWQMIGTCSWHACSTFMCLRLQIFVMMAILATGTAAYCVLEIKLSRQKSTYEKLEGDRLPK